MQASDIPTYKFQIPFGNGASGTYKTVPIPTASQIGISAGRASLTDGFVPVNFQSVASGGIPPDGRDFNGILYEVTGWERWVQAGGPIQYDATFSTAIGGYPAGAVLMSNPAGLLWLCTADNNTTNPDSGGANWVPLEPQPATNAQTIAGLLTSVFVTPASLAAWFAAGPQSSILLATNGYYPLPGGLLVQWGRFSITGPSANLTVSFPEPFPNACFTCVVAGGNSTTAQDNQVSLVGSSINVSQFQARFVPTGTVTGTFIALGN